MISNRVTPRHAWKRQCDRTRERAMRIRHGIGSSRIRHRDEFSVAARQSWWTRVRPFVFVEFIRDESPAQFDRGPVTTIESEIAPWCVASRAMRRPIGRTRAAERRLVSKERKSLFANWSHHQFEMRLRDAAIASPRNDRSSHWWMRLNEVGFNLGEYTQTIDLSNGSIER